MCGIAGLLTGEAPLDQPALTDVVSSMAGTLGHRGPDDQGVWVDGDAGLALGHRRLAVIDVSAAGHQPMASRSGRWVVSYNGEIYNFPELKSLLESRGSAFRGTSDTEVLVEGLDAWGVEGTLERANGMFAFAAWDRTGRTLYLARDRLGEKPLYYGRVGDTVVFASELKALRAVPGFSGELDPNALALYLRYGYVPAPYSIYRGISKLPAGCVVAVDAAGAIGSPRAYWSVAGVIEQAAREPFDGDPTEAADELERLIRDSVGIRMISDVPLGAFLSGGIDSSLVVAAMTRVSSGHVRTFTIGFTDPRFDEAPFARAVAQHLETAHTELYVTPGEAMDVLPELPRMYDEPFADSSQIPTALVSRLARRQVTVCLSGDGGDELFGGYDRYWLGRSAWRKLRAAPWVVRRPLAATLSSLGGSDATPAAAYLPAPPRASDWVARGRRLGTILGHRRPADLYDYFLSQWQRSSSMVAGATKDIRVAPPSPGVLRSFVDRAMYRDQITYLPDDILAKVDRATMAASLESRIPLLDPRIVAFAASLPAAFKMNGPGGKWLLRRVLERFVPHELTDRPKHGFGVPVGDWIRGPLRGWAEDLLTSTTLASAIDPAPARLHWRQHLDGTHDHTAGLWTVLMLASWLEAERNAPRTTPARTGSR